MNEARPPPRINAILAAKGGGQNRIAGKRRLPWHCADFL